MTRINLVLVTELTDQHLLAEHREIKRIPHLIKQGKYSLKGQPSEYTMGKGHVKFFYDKLKFLHFRYIALYTECKCRGFDVQDYRNCFEGIDKKLFGWYIETKEAIDISRQRIQEKIDQKPDFYTLTTY